MDNFQALQSNDIIKMLEQLPYRSSVRDIVPCSPEVGCIETDTQAVFVLRQYI